jgi:Ser/Thr protein kinase RdoA (MazF antagonist)
VYRLKWCCIMLNDFLPAGNDRRRFAAPVDEMERKWKQLEKARTSAEQLVHGDCSSPGPTAAPVRAA